MEHSIATIPHVLAIAYVDLVRKLDEGLEQFRTNLQYSNCPEVCEAIERFVDEFCRIPSWADELEARATLIERRCKADTAFWQRREAAFRGFPGWRKKASAARALKPHLAFWDLDPTRDVQSQRELNAIITAVKQAEREEIAPSRCRKAFRVWLDEARRIDHDARRSVSDGCAYLMNVYRAWDSTATERAELDEAILQTRLGGGWLEEIRAAADSLVSWASDHSIPVTQTETMPDLKVANGAVHYSAADTKPIPNPDKQAPIDQGIGRDPKATKKRSTEKGEGRIKLIAALTQHHRYEDGSCLNLEPVGNNELARLADVAKRTASAFFRKQFEGHAKYRVLCNDPALLVAALKALRGEYRPRDFYGARKPDKTELDFE